MSIRTRLEFSHDYTSNSIYATIETNNLFLRPIEESHEYNCYAVYNTPEAMEKYLDGTTKDVTHTVEKIKIFANRWLTGDPFSGFAVYVKEGRGRETFAGIVILDHGDDPGVAKLEGIGNVEFWNQGYGTEATEALIHVLAPHLAAERYLVGRTNTEVGQPLRKIVATCRMGNTSTLRTLDCIMRRNINAELNYGILWLNYEYNLSQKNTRHMCVLL